MFSLASRSLETAPWGERVQRILAAALQAVDPAEAVFHSIQRYGDRLRIGGRSYNLSHYKRVLIVGTGKAGAPMARAAGQLAGGRLEAGIVLVKEGYAQDLSARKIRILEAGHPLPDLRGVTGSAQIIELLNSTQPEDLVICLISGGGSALMVSPAPGLNLSDLQALTSELLACGATIFEINTLRKHLEQLKGGNLARLAYPATLAALILSDVVGDPLDVIGSGPTVPDSSTYSDAYQVLEKYHLLDKAPPSVLAHLRKGIRGDLPETPKAGDPVFERVNNVIIGSNRLAAQAALDQARSEGFQTLLLTTYLHGEARHVGRVLAAIALQIAEDGRPIQRPGCLVAGGETTVTIQGDGMGGRNQELALSAVSDLAGLPGIALVTLSTDGGDGPTDAAGAVATGETLERARQAGMDPADYLARSDSYHFFDRLGDLLKPGPTQTNVNDLAFIFAF